MLLILGKFVPIIISILMLGVAFTLRKMVGTWLLPGVLLAIFWFLYTFVPLIFVPEIQVNYLSIAYILCCVLAFCASSMFFDWKSSFEANSVKSKSRPYFDGAFIKASFVASSMSSLVFFLVNMLVQGISIGEMFTDTLNVAGRYIAMRYEGTLQENLYSKISLAFSYLSVSLGGLVFGQERKTLRRTGVMLLAFVPAFSSMLFQGDKGLLFLFITLFYAGFLVTQVFRAELKLYDRDLLKLSTVLFLLVVPAVIAAFLSRGLQSESDSYYVASRLSFYLRSYAFGHLYAFDDWFRSYSGDISQVSYAYEDAGYGFYTFMSIFNLLGAGREVPHGVYEEYYFFGEVLSTNIYTMFRGLIVDFGIAGSIIFVFLLGLVVHAAFYFLLNTKRPALWVAIFVYSIGYFYTSFIISLMIWNVIPFSIVLFAMILAISSMLRSESDPLSVVKIQ